jgi:hypothetical protein
MDNLVMAVAETLLTLTPSTQDSGFSAGNLLTDFPHQQWQTTGLTVSLEIDRGSVLALNTLGFIASNLRQTDTLRVRTANSQAALTAGPSWDSNGQGWPSGIPAYPAGNTWMAEWGSRDWIFYNAALPACQFVRLDATITAHPDGYFRAGNLVVADGKKFARNYAFGAGTGLQELGTKERTEAGYLQTEDHGRLRCFEFTLEQLTAAERNAFILPLDRARGTVKPVLVIGDPDVLTGWEEIFGDIETLESVRVPFQDVYERRFRIVERPANLNGVLRPLLWENWSTNWEDLTENWEEYDTQRVTW